MTSIKKTDQEKEFEFASQWQLIWRSFRQHRAAMICGIIIGVMYLSAIFAPFVAPYDPQYRHRGFVYAPPQRVHFSGDAGFSIRPHVYRLTSELDMDTFERRYAVDTDVSYPLYFLVRGQPYKLWGLFRTDIRLFGTSEGGHVFLFGTDGLGRDLFTRVIHGGTISMSIGLVGVFFSFVFGLMFGGVSGYFGGKVDEAIQRMIEILRSFPRIPLWMAFSAALPGDWSPIRIYFSITLILSLVGWTELARVTRGKVLSLKNEDFVMAARISGTSEFVIIARHLIPSFISHIIAAITLAIPQMILAETALSFLGVGLRPPVVSWGVLLQTAQNVHTVAMAPWLMIPGVFVIIYVMAFNFLGDGFRDAADPYAN